MKLRRSVGLIAIVGVLLHAFTIVRHHAVMMADALPASTRAEAALRAASASPFGKLPICRGNGASSLDDLASDESRENGPSQPRRSTPCPVCCSSVAAYAVAPSLFAFLVLPHAGPLEPPATSDRPREVERRTHAPARGPPATA